MEHSVFTEYFLKVFFKAHAATYRQSYLRTQWDFGIQGLFQRGRLAVIHLSMHMVLSFGCPKGMCPNFRGFN